MFPEKLMSGIVILKSDIPLESHVSERAWAGRGRKDSIKRAQNVQKSEKKEKSY